MENNYCVYKHTAPNGKVYIGITKQSPQRRWGNGKGYKANQHFYSAIQKYGWGNIDHEIIEIGLSKAEAEQKEKDYIALYNSTNKNFGYNMTLGGESGAKITEEVKRVISEKLKNYYSKPENLEPVRQRQIGKKHSKETKEKMSAAHKAMMTEEFRKKLSETRKGRKINHPKGILHTEESKRKISESKRGKHYGGIGKKPCPILCVETNTIYEHGAQEAARKIGKNARTILSACGGKRKTAYGFHWQYVKENKSGRETA